MPLNDDLARIVEQAGTYPRFASLVEALTEKCPGCTEGFVWRPVGRKLEPEKHARCGGSGRVLRSWDDQPQGALKGTLLVACEKANLWPDVDDWFALSDEDLAAAVLKELEKEVTHATED